MAVLDRFYGTGRRKTSVARVWIKPGSGRFLVNRRPFEDFFPRETLRMIILQPLQVTNTAGQFDVVIRVGGGGPTGQAGAVRHGLSRAIPLRREAPFAPQEGWPAHARPAHEGAQEVRSARGASEVPVLEAVARP